MFFSKLKLLKIKSQNFIICLTISLLTYSVVIHFNNKEVLDDCFPKHLNKYLNVDENYVAINTSLDIDSLRAKLEKMNKDREVRNVREYGPVSGETPIVAVRVHRDLDRLQLLVASLAQAAGIDDVLLVFSHSYYDRRINHLIRQIDFCMVLQIFYLNSVQLNPNSFPGFDSEESAEVSVSRNATRSKRDPRLTEPKHHWWWTVNHVFDQLVWHEPHTDVVIFIDESSYVLPDLLFMVGSAKYATSYFPDADVISLGRVPARDSDYDRLTLETWRAAHGDGLAFNRSTWERISALGWHYCNYDDTSWSHSLLHLFRWFPGGRAVALATLAPRVLDTGALPHLCWLATQHRLFPRKVQAVVLYGREGKVLSAPEAPCKGNGGWSDSRDIFHCYENTIAQENVTTAFPEPG